MRRARPLLLAVAMCVCAAMLAIALPVSVHGASNTGHTSPSPPSSSPSPAVAPRTLMLLADRSQLQSHSALIDMLRARGHVLTTAVAGEEVVKLDKFGTFLFDGLVLLAPSAEDLALGAADQGQTLDAVQRFIDSGRSVLMAGGVSMAEPMRELAAEFGFDVDEEGTRVQDHGAFATAPANDADPSFGAAHDVVVATIDERARAIVGGEKATTAPLLFRGLGHVAQSSQLLTPVVRASGSAYSYALGAVVSEYPAAAGRDVLLVSALQTRSNARVVYCGSVDLLSDDFMNRSFVSAAHSSLQKSGNEAFTRELLAWTFHERGLLRARKLTHVKIGAEHDVNPQSYRVQDHISFSIVIEEFDGVSKQWVPYTRGDVQLELTMLDPHVRLPLSPSPSSPGVHSASFQLPDVYGVYKFVIEHRRIGYSNLDVAAQVSVRPFRHDEFDRFIGQAYPYYTAAFTIMAAFFTFGIVFLYTKE